MDDHISFWSLLDLAGRFIWLIARVLVSMLPLIIVRIVVPLPDYIAGMIDLILIAAPALGVVAALAFTFLSIARR